MKFVLSVAAGILAAGALLSVAPVPVAPVAAQPQRWIASAAAHRIMHMRHQEHSNAEVAAVIIEAPADKVYEVALQRARNNKQAHVTMVDPARRQLQLREGEHVVTLSIAMLTPEASELYVLATSGGRHHDSSASRIVQAIVNVCIDLRKECRVAQ